MRHPVQNACNTERGHFKEILELCNLLKFELLLFERGGGEDNVSASASFIANEHNKLYAFYTEKSSFLKKNSEPMRRGGAPTFESITGVNCTIKKP